MVTPFYRLQDAETTDDSDLVGTAEGADIHDADATVMWWASKMLDRSKLLSDFCGKNDKTKIVVQLTKKGAGAPMRESQQNSKSEQEAMMAYYFKKKVIYPRFTLHFPLKKVILTPMNAIFTLIHAILTPINANLTLIKAILPLINALLPLAGGMEEAGGGGR